MDRRPEFDGLRGVAVLLVVVGHAAAGVFPHYNAVGGWRGGGGVIGVQLFFALSGFLITSILLVEAGGDGVGLARFYARRAGRLLPALLLCCAGFAAYAVATGLAGASGDLFLAITYTTNLGAVRDQIGTAGWLGHTWSLAVEEQFYVAWPIVLIVAYRLRGRDGVALAAVAGALATIWIRSGLEGANIYESMRWDALLWGCWLAAARPRIPRGTAVVAGGVLLAYFVASSVPLSPVDFTVTAIASAAFVADAGRVSWLRNRGLVYFGTISYGLYLWHVLLGRLDVTPALTVAASVLIAHLSFRFVEAPVLALTRRRLERSRARGPGTADAGPRRYD